MLNFSFYSPTYFEFGKNTQTKTAQLVKRFGGTRVLVHYGGGSVVKSGLLDTIKTTLESENIPYVELGGVKPNPVADLVYKGIDLCRKEKIDFILAVGGGSVIDSAKAIAAGVPYDGDFWDFYGDKKEVTEALPVGTVLTIAAAGSEGSPNSVITHEEKKLKVGSYGEVLRPVFSILNPELTCTLPPYQTAAGITDIFLHVVERYFSTTKDVEFTDRLCEAVLHTLISQAPVVIKNPNDYEARANIMWAGTVAHNNLCGVGRNQDWASHRLEHQLSAFYDVTHGAGLAVIAPAWMKYVSKIKPEKFLPFATRVFGCEMDFEHPERTIEEGIKRFEHFLKSIGMPLTIKELGIENVDIPAMLSNLTIMGGTCGGYVKLDLKDMEAIYRIANEEV